MGQYYMLENVTKGESKHVGKFYGDFGTYIKHFGWDSDDFIIAHGDYGDTIYYNDPYEVPKDYVDTFERSEWIVIEYAARRLNITPEQFAEDFLNDD